MTITPAQAATLKRDLMAALIANAEAAAALLKMSDQLGALSAAVAEPPPVAPPVAQYKPGMGWTSD